MAVKDGTVIRYEIISYLQIMQRTPVNSVHRLKHFGTNRCLNLCVKRGTQFPHFFSEGDGVPPFLGDLEGEL